MPKIDLSEAEIAEMFGGQAEAIDTDPDQIAVGLALRSLRDGLLEAAKVDGVGVNQLASRLGIAPSSVSRLLGGEGDMRVSTAVLYARALGRAWTFALNDDRACRPGGNYQVMPMMTVLPANSSGASSSMTLRISTLNGFGSPVVSLAAAVQIRAVS